jgi:hypothetical protein
MQQCAIFNPQTTFRASEKTMSLSQYQLIKN